MELWNGCLVSPAETSSCVTFNKENGDSRPILPRTRITLAQKVFDGKIALLVEIRLRFKECGDRARRTATRNPTLLCT
jgi:hypothetical protein